MNTVLTREEQAIFGLRSLYECHGYTRYRMSKFEEYDLYARNKDFLISDGVITFNDADGKLLALKPDVTLSIIKNSDDSEGLKKVYYNENVYRVSKSSRAFREIVQMGLECIGEIDTYALTEALLLAAKSLKSISDSCVLGLSHLGILSDLLDRTGVSAEIRDRLIRCIGEKNEHDLIKTCREAGVEVSLCEALTALCRTHGSPRTVMADLRAMTVGIDSRQLDVLETICVALEREGLGDMLSVDFSVVSDIRYYNGIAFKGFVEGIPDAVLSGGQYDRLMQKMGRRSGAVGFAVYLDLLQRLDGDETPYDVDTVLLYDEGCDVAGLLAAVVSLNREGRSVSAQRCRPEKLTYRHLMKFDGNEVTEIEYA